METETPKLSALMREGAQLHPQGKENYFSLDRRGNIQATCALGAPYEAYYRIKGQSCIYPSYSNMEQFLGDLGLSTHSLVQEPIHLIWMPLHDAITDLNDDQGWTREAIADWLEQQGL